MKIGIVVTILDGFGEKGFYHSQEFGLAKELVKRGHDVILYKCVYKDKPETSEKIESENGIFFVDEIPVKNIGAHGIINVSHLDKELDAIVMFSDTQLSVPKVYKFCKRNGITFIPYAGIFRSTKKKKAKTRLMDFLFRVRVLPVYRKCPPVVKTKEAQKEIENMGVPNCKIAHVGLDISKLKTDFRGKDRRALRREYGYTDDDIVLSFIAKIEPHKRPLDAIEILNTFKDDERVKLIVAGKGFEMADLKNKVQEYGLTERVQILGKIPYDDIWKIHYISDYYLNLSEIEIFGMAVMEAAFYESSVCAMKCSPGPKTILDGAEGHKLCNDDDEIVDWIKKGKPDIETLKKSSKMIATKFSWKRLCEIIEGGG